MKTQLDLVRAQRDKHLAELNEAHHVLERIDALAKKILTAEIAAFDTKQPALDIREAISTYFNLGTA